MTWHRFRTYADFAVPVQVAFDYLADPRNRPEWQSSLMSVTLADRGEPRVGLQWRDATVIGIRPRLEIVELDPPHRWVEHGRWQGVEVVLSLDFEQRSQGCRVVADGRLSGRGPYAVAAWLAGRLAGPAARADLRKAGRLLERRN